MTDKEKIFRFLDRVTTQQKRLIEGAKEFLLGELLVESEEELNDLIVEWEKERKDSLNWRYH